MRTSLRPSFFLLVLGLGLGLPSFAQQAPTCDLAELGARFRDGAVGSSWQEKGERTAWLDAKVDLKRSWTRVLTRESEERWGVRYLAFEHKYSKGAFAPVEGALTRGEKRWTWAWKAEPADRSLKDFAKEEAGRRSRQAGPCDWLAQALPKAPVKVGETWTLELADMVRLLEVPYAEAPAPKTSSASGKLIELSASHATVEVEVKLDYPGDAKTSPAEAGLKLRATLPRKGVSGSLEVSAWIKTPDASVKELTRIERSEVPKK